MRVQEAVSETADGPTHWPACVGEPARALFDRSRSSLKGRAMPCICSKYSTGLLYSTVDLGRRRD